VRACSWCNTHAAGHRAARSSSSWLAVAVLICKRCCRVLRAASGTAYGTSGKLRSCMWRRFAESSSCLLQACFAFCALALSGLPTVTAVRQPLSSPCVPLAMPLVHILYACPGGCV
jgi:hypothetical protein